MTRKGCQMGKRKIFKKKKGERKPQQRRKCAANYSKEDRISELPDAIIATILSRLSNIRKAIRTSVLSKRWRYLWTHVTCLNVDIQMAAGYRCYRLLGDGEECEHGTQYKWLTQFFKFHQGSTLDRFTISVSSIGKFRELCPALLELLPDWIRLALSKRVQSLEIDLYKYQEYGDGFLEKLLESPFGVSCIKYLKHISLNGLQISSELVEHFLSNGHQLEHLSISGSRDLSNLKVFGSSSLKFLQISNCKSLYKVEISAPNLVSFVCDGCFLRYGSTTPIVLNHAPSLVNLSYSAILMTSFPACTKGFLCFSSFLHQLETLNLVCTDWSRNNGTQWIRNIVLPESTELTSLKNLSLMFEAYPFEKSLLDLTSWIERSPFLRSFKLQIKWRKIPRFEKQMQRLKKCTHQCLKVVKLYGFVGYANEIEFAMYLIENVMALENIIIEPNKEKLPFWATHVSKNLKMRKFSRRAIKERAISQLEKKLPPGAKLSVL